MSDAPTVLFHVSSALFMPGEMIQPGNWGRTIEGRGAEGHPLFYKEQLFEHVRLTEFPERVSRLRAAFAFTEADIAWSWVKPETPQLYVVSAADHRIAVLDMVWLTHINRFRTTDGVLGCVRAYWRGEQTQSPTWEVLVDGPLAVVGRLTPIGENGVHR